MLPGTARWEVHRALYVAVHAVAAALAVAVAGGSAPAVVAFVAGAIAAELADRHRPHRLSASALDDLTTFAVRGIVIGALATAAGFAVAGTPPRGIPAAAAPVITATCYAMFAVTGLALGYAGLRRLRARRRLTSRAVIVGTGPVGMEIYRRLHEHPEYGITPTGFVDRLSKTDADRLPAPLIAGLRDLPSALDVEDIDYVFVAPGAVADDRLVNLLRTCDRSACEILLVPHLFDVGAGGGSSADHLWGLPLVRLNRATFRCRTWPLKRAFDVIFAAVALTLTAPVMAVIALALRAEVGPSVIFRQVRVGLDGRPFVLLKFRSLAVRGGDEPPAWGGVPADRAGPVGRFLRRTSLDELPQFWNVLRGDMSVVGPRPEQPHFVAQFVRTYRGYRDRLRAPAGITGWSQIHGLRGSTSIEDRIRFDNFYIDHWSLGQDLKIILRTIASVFAMRGR